MATANSIIKRAIRLITADSSITTPDAYQLADGLEALNAMTDAFSIERLMIYQILEENFSLVASTASYTIGSGGTFNTTRPVKIENAFIRDSGNNDYPVTIIHNETYDAFTLKTSDANYPEYLYYDPQYPLGKIYLYPTPNTTYTLYINSWKQLQSFASGATTVALPPGYEDMLAYNLAVRIAPEYGVQAPQLVMKLATDTKAQIKRHNTVPVLLSVSDVAMLGGQGGRSNIYQGA